MICSGKSCRGVYSRTCCAVAASLFVFTFAFASAKAAEKKDEKKVDPKITCVAPFVVKPGVTKTIKIRGLGLAEASGVKMTDAGGTVERFLANGQLGSITDLNAAVQHAQERAETSFGHRLLLEAGYALAMS